MPVATTEGVRRSNLATTLGILYRQGPASRAALSKRTGRNRSTIASLVNDLVELGLVVENEPDSMGQVGRPSPVVSIRPEVAAIAVNPEIDALTIGLSKELGPQGVRVAALQVVHERGVAGVADVAGAVFLLRRLIGNGSAKDQPIALHDCSRYPSPLPR